MERKMIARQLLFQALVLVMLASCRPTTVSSKSYIGKQQAIDAALEIASTSWPEVSGPQKEVSNIRAEQMTLDEAVKQIAKNNQLPNGYRSDSKVWFITMDGLWLNEMDAPGVVTTPAPYHHYAIIIDAKTGSALESSLTP